MKRLAIILLLATVPLYGQVVTASGHKLMLFGGKDHKTYLGCLSCSPAARDSVLNEIGPYGSEIARDSIFNKIGAFGSEISDTSPCNEIGSHPPVIVDERGSFYGYLTLNEITSKRNENEKLNLWLKKVCKDD